MANCATIGGYVQVGRGAFLGGQSVFHQNIRIGEMAITPPNSGKSFFFYCCSFHFYYSPKKTVEAASGFS